MSILAKIFNTSTPRHSCARGAMDSLDLVPRRVVLIWVIFLLLRMALGLYDLRGNWQTVQGWEMEEVARSIAGGHGFSFPPTGRWMFGPSDSGEYHPTALQEPLYPILMAISLKALGAYGWLAILVFQMISLLLTCIVVYCLGRMVFNSWAGILAGSFLAMLPAAQHTARGILSNAIFAGLMVSISACLIIWCLEKMSVRRGVALGLVLGFNCLTLATTLLFIPISVLLVLSSARPFRPVVWKAALAILLTAAAIVSPWTMRNLLVFGRFVPVRTGFGLIAHQGNPILAATFSPGLHACSDTLGLLWKAKNAGEAIRLSRESFEKRSAIYKRSFDCMEQDAPDGYERFNEAERDEVYLKKTMDFIRSEPETFAMITYHKSLAFFTGWSISNRVVALLALVGALIALRIRRARILTLLTLAYVVPYSFGISWHYRYRYPIEPIFLVLSSYVVTLAAEKFNELQRSKFV